MDGEQIEERLHASLDDEAVLAFDVPSRIFGFHAQQVVEKLLKSLILTYDQPHGRGHDIKILMQTLARLGEVLPSTTFAAADLTAYAVQFRYVEPAAFSETDRADIRHSVRIFREPVNARIDALRQ